MNFYKHHIGDYAQATAHLSFVEDAAFSRLLRKYYAEERPIPADLKAAQRLVGARSKDEREAVEVVLGEFFTLEANGWHNKRADEELAKANAIADTNRRIAEEREAAKRATKAARSVHEPLDASCLNREPSQTPDTRHQEETGDSRQAPEITQGQGTTAGLACRLMREAGCVQTNPSHPDLIAALAEGVTPQALADTAREAIAGNVRKPFAYAITTARGRHRDGPKPTPGATHVGSHQRGQGRRLSAVDQVQQAIDERHEREREGRTGPGRTFDA